MNILTLYLPGAVFTYYFLQGAEQYFGHDILLVFAFAAAAFWGGLIVRSAVKSIEDHQKLEFQRQVMERARAQEAERIFKEHHDKKLAQERKNAEVAAAAILSGQAKQARGAMPKAA